MSVPPISDYGFLSDCRSAALVSRAGSVDWWCPDRFDRPSVFGRLLDPSAGHWTLGPVGEPTTAPGAAGPGHRVRREYLTDSLVLRTVHDTPYGSVAVTDALATAPGARGHELGRDSPAVLLREVRGLTGRVRMRSEFLPRPEYGLLTPYLHETPGGLVAAAGPVTLTLRADVPLRRENGRAEAEFDVTAGQSVGFCLAYAPAYGPAPAVLDPAAALAETAVTWQSLRNSHRYDGRYPEQVRRSALVLQGLTYVPSGAVAAAATTSLPEQLGADRNYDYRFAWLRDFSFTMHALWVAACPDETSRLFAWAARSAGRIDPERPVPIMYGLAGERDLTEHTLEHLRGYGGSRPVRIGNDAWRQRQLDVPGEVIDAAYRLREQLDGLDEELCDMLVGLAEQVVRNWRRPDAGMWEARDEERHYLSSKVMCWQALDRAVRLAPVLGRRADPARWAAVRNEIHATVVERGWHERVGAYTGAFGSPELDASVLVLPVVGFLPATDPRMRATIAAVRARLSTDGLVRRWDGDPAGFLLCSFWLVESLVLAGERQQAEMMFELVLRHGNDLGLLSEQVDPATGQQLGNTPQALSHVGLINAAWRLTDPTYR